MKVETAPIPRAVLGLLLVVTLAISTSFGMLLLLPLRIAELGGDEADFGVVTAAAIPAAFALGALARASRRVRPALLLAAASLLYGVAALLVGVVDSVGPALVALGLVLGTAWAVAYTAAPVIINELVGDRARGRAIGYVTGTIQVGFGLGAVVGGFLHRLGLSYPAVFYVAAGLAGVAAAVVLPLVGRLRAVSGVRSDDEPSAPANSDLPLGRALVLIFRSPAAVPLVMVLLSACLFTTMNSFQTTFADERGLNYDLFFVCYTIAVIVVRLGVAPLLADSTSDRVMRLTTAGIAVSVLGFILVGSSTALYALVSLLLGDHLRPGPAGDAGPRGQFFDTGAAALPAAPRRAAVRGGDPRIPLGGRLSDHARQPHHPKRSARLCPQWTPHRLQSTPWIRTARL
jgi:MFS family permease